MKTMKTIKKLTAALLMGAVVLSFGACGNSGNSTGGNFDKAEDISVVSREDGSGTRGAFIELFGVEVKDDKGNKKDNTTANAIISNKTDVMLANIAGDSQAIGYVSLGSLNHTVKAVTIDGTEATADNIKAGTYTVSRPFNIVTKGDVSELAKDFISYILSAEGQTIVNDNKYIEVNETAQAYAGLKPQGKIVIAGSSSVSPVMEKLVESYKAINKDAEIEIQTSDSTAGVTGCIEGTCDIGMASRDLKDTEKESLKATAIALDGIAVIVNQENPISNMTKDQVKSIFVG
ncbi:MAG: substrate-binding domain-containing protein, partial [Clostridiales bacterium]